MLQSTADAGHSAASSSEADTLSTRTTTNGKPHDMANVCRQTVPVEHYVDGIPAYTQCADSGEAGIWSSDGVTTSTTSDPAWRRTQWSGGYQCTEFANRYMYFTWGVERIPNGNAGTWCEEEPPIGLVQAATPVHGDLIVFAPGSCGASSETGHVAVIDEVDGDNLIIVEQNRAGRRRTQSACAACFLHAEANDGL